MATLPCLSENRSGHELTTKFVLDVNPDNVVKALFGGGEAKLERPFRLEIARPSLDNAHNERIRLASDPPCHLISRHPLQRFDLFAHGCRQAGHGEIAAWAHRRTIDGCGVKQEAH